MQFGSDPARGSGPALNWLQPRDPEGLREFRYPAGTYGALAAGDLDGDGLLDLVAGGDGALASVFKNEGGFEFSEVTAQVGLSNLPGRSFALADFDNDGDLDLLASSRFTTAIYENRDGIFVAAHSLASPESAAVQLLPLDYDNDGLLDFFAAHPLSFSLSDRTGPNRLYHNLGALQFEDVTESMGIAPDGLTWAAAAFDYDGDGDLDIFAANDGGTVDFGQGPVPRQEQELPHNVLLENRGDHFADRAAELGLQGPYSSMGALWEDFDHDGDFDLFVPDFGANKLLVREKQGFVERGAAMGFAAPRRFNDACPADSDNELCLMVSWGSAFVDLDFDGKQELVLLNHEDPSGAAQPVQLFVQKGEHFVERSAGLANLPAHVLVTSDLDGDGDLDVLASSVGEGLLVFENVAPDGCGRTGLTVRLQGERSNRQGLGARVEVRLDDGSVQRRVLGVGGMAHASLPAEVHFGLGGHTAAELTVHWPSGLTTRTRPDRGARRITVGESNDP